MRAPVIRKDPQRFAVPPNLPAMDGVRARFSWEAIGHELDGLPGGALNIAHEAIDRHASGAQGEHVAVRFLWRDGGSRDYTYAELARLTNRFANVLRKLGVAKGERLFILAGRIPELYIGAMGALKAGVVVCPLFSAFGPDPVRMRLALGEGSVVLTTEALYRRKLEKSVPSLPALKHVILAGESGQRTDVAGTHDLAQLMAEASDAFAIEATGPEDASFLHFTSGTTGTPKGAMHVHGAAVMHYATGKYALDLHRDDIYWCTADPGWVTGTSYGIVAPLLHGVTSIVDEADFDAERWYRILEEQSVSVWYTAPTAIRMLMKAGPELAKAHRLPEAALRGERGRAPQSRGGVVGRGRAGPSDPRQLVADGDRRHHDRQLRRDGREARLHGQAASRRRGVHRRAPSRRHGARRGNARHRGRARAEARLARMFRGYLGQEERYRKCFAGELYLTRRPRQARRRRLLLVRGPRRRRDQVRGAPHRTLRGGKRADGASGGGRGRRDRQARSGRGRDREGVRVPEEGLRAVGGAAHGNPRAREEAPGSRGRAEGDRVRRGCRRRAAARSCAGS